MRCPYLHIYPRSWIPLMSTVRTRRNMYALNFSERQVNTILHNSLAAQNSTRSHNVIFTLDSFGVLFCSLPCQMLNQNPFMARRHVLKKTRTGKQAAARKEWRKQHPRRWNISRAFKRSSSSGPSTMIMSTLEHISIRTRDFETEYVAALPSTPAVYSK